MIQKLLRFIDMTTIRFLIVGLFNTFVGTTVMFLAYNLLGLGYWISSLLNYVIGSIVSYFLNKYFTFRNKDKSIRMIIRFIANIAVCYLLAYGIAKPLVYLLLSQFNKLMKDNLAMLAGMCFFFLFNYIGQRYIVFVNKEHKNEI